MYNSPTIERRVGNQWRTFTPAEGHTSRSYCEGPCEACLFEMVQAKARTEVYALGSGAWFRQQEIARRMAEFAADFDAGLIVWDQDTPFNTRTNQPVL